VPGPPLQSLSVAPIRASRLEDDNEQQVGSSVGPPLGSQDLSEADLLSGRLGATPSGSVFRVTLEPSPLSVGRRSNVVRRPVHYSVQAWVGRVDMQIGSHRLCA